MESYRKRIADEVLKRKLLGTGAVLIEGAKWCGKTTTAEQQAKSTVYMDATTEGVNWKQMAEISPQIILNGETPRLIDEWQIAPTLWDSIRYEVDHRRIDGQFILTGSSVPANTEMIRHSGTGRFSWLKMRPMSLWESGDSNGSVSLSELFRCPNQLISENQLTLEDIAFLTCRGGWPRAVSQQKSIALDRAFDYIDAVARNDISRVDNIRRDEGRTLRIMRSYARHQGTQIPISMIAEDVKLNDTKSLDDKTVYSYITALKKIYVIEDMPSWNPNLRSKTAIRTSDNKYFVDPSIATGVLGLGPSDLLNDLNSFGLFFETLCVRDLRIFADALNGQVFHYRDKNGLECDTVLHLRNGSYGLIEIKLGGETLIDEGAKSLKKLSSIIDTTKMKQPSFLLVLTAVGKYAYRREDGIYVVPIGCLKD